MIRSLALLICLTGLFSPLCAANEGQALLPLVELQIGQTTITAEVARSPEELSAGLMFREKLADNVGMLFCLKREGTASFWMANTSIPLSIAYLDRAGKILEIHELKPLDLTRVPSKSDQVYYALEMNRGWFELNKIKPGDLLKPAQGSLANLRTARLPP
jgi:uncharacterized protein